MMDQVKFLFDDDSVVVIVGLGVGGGMLVNELVQCGVKCVVLEVGKYYMQVDFENDEWVMFNKILWLDKCILVGGWYYIKMYLNLFVWIVKGVGGFMVYWLGVVLCFQEYDFYIKIMYGVIDGVNVLDWLIMLFEFEFYYELVEKKMGVCGIKVSGLFFMLFNNYYKVIEVGVKKVGYKYIVWFVVLNFELYDGCLGCMQIGFCMQGCKIGVKWLMFYIEVLCVQVMGNVELWFELMVFQIQYDKQGCVNGVFYVDSKGCK